MPKDERTGSQSPADRSSTISYEQFMRGAKAFSIVGEQIGSKARLSLLESFAAGKSEAVLNTIAGGTAGAISGFVTCPLDVIKTKLQAQGGFRAHGAPVLPSSLAYNGMLGTAKVIWAEEGLRGMYRGLGPIILGYLPTWATWFVIYGKSKAYFKQSVDNENVVSFMSSIVAGGCSTLVTNPIWVIKTRMMSQVSRRSSANVVRPPWHYSSTLDAVRKMYRTEGILSFYSGLTPALLGLSHVAVQFPAYEYLKKRFTGGVGLGEHSEPGEKHHFIAISSASFVSKLLASAATYPHEVIRTRLQTQQRSMPSTSSEYTTFRGGLENSQGIPAANVARVNRGPRYKGIVTTFNTILREEGWRAFYAGMGTNMMRAVPAAMTTMISYEYVIKQLHTARSEGQSKIDGSW